MDSKHLFCWQENTTVSISPSGNSVMIWVAGRIVPPSSSEESGKFILSFWAMLFLGFFSLPFFLLYGYHSVSIGPVSLPLAAIISGLEMITWYWFA